MTTDYEFTQELQLLRESADRLRGEIARTPSKAGIIGPGFDRAAATSSEGAWLTAIINASSRDAERQAEGKAALADLGVLDRRDAWGKATLGTTDASGGYLVPNNRVAEVVQVASATNPLRNILNVVTGVSGDAVDIPFAGAPSRAAVVARGATKPNQDLVLGNYTATLYTLARIYDVAEQLIRHSAGAAERMVRLELTKSIAQGEAYYVISGSGTSEPKGINTSLAAAPAAFTSSHTASDSTVAGSVRRAVATMIEALASRNYTPNAILMNPGDHAHSFAQGADAAGFWVDENGGTRLLGLPIITTTMIASKTAIVGDFSAATLFVGDNLRVDVSREAGDRWDKNLVGFRGESEVGFNADPPVLAGAFQRVTTLIP